MSQTNLDINYTGKEIADLITQPLYLQNPFFGGGYGARIEETIKSTAVWHDTGFTVSLRDQQCEPTNPDSPVLTQKEVVLCKKQAYAQVCRDDLLATFRELQYRSGQNAQAFTDDTQLTAAITANLVNATVAAFANLIILGETEFFSGSVSGDACPSLLSRFYDDSEIVTVNGTTISKSNVIGEVEKVILAYPVENKQAGVPRPRIAVSQWIADNLLFAIQGDSFIQQDPTSPWNFRLYGYDFTIIPQLPNNIMFMTWPENILAFTDLTTDLSELRVVDNYSYSVNRNVDMVMRFAAAITYGRPEQIVFYRPQP